MDVVKHMFIIADCGARLAWAIAVRVPSRLKTWVLIFLIAAIGAGLSNLREEIIKTIAPDVHLHARLAVDTAKGIIILIDGIRLDLYATKIIVYAIKEFLHIGSTAAGPPDAPTFHWPVFTAATVDRVASDAEQCSSYTAGMAIESTIKTLASDAVCPVLRAAWPMTLVRPFLPVAAWLSYDYTPYPGNNCMTPVSDYNNTMCALLSIGGLLLEVVVPIMVFALVATECAKELYYFIKSIIELPLVIVTAMQAAV